MKSLVHFKKKSIGLLSAVLLMASFNVCAQKKSVYDVIPGSGPKKTQTSKNVVIFGKQTTSRRNTYPVYTTRRKNLPPGQAKKIYGGSATDYAPGQVKKHHGDSWKKEHGNHGEKHGKRH